MIKYDFLTNVSPLPCDTSQVSLVPPERGDPSPGKMFCLLLPSFFWTFIIKISWREKYRPYFGDGVLKKCFVVNLCDSYEAFWDPKVALSSYSAFCWVLALLNPDHLKTPIWSSRHNLENFTFLLVLILLRVIGKHFRSYRKLQMQGQNLLLFTCRCIIDDLLWYQLCVSCTGY